MVKWCQYQHNSPLSRNSRKWSSSQLSLASLKLSSTSMELLSSALLTTICRFLPFAEHSSSSELCLREEHGSLEVVHAITAATLVTVLNSVFYGFYSKEYCVCNISHLILISNDQYMIFILTFSCCQVVCLKLSLLISYKFKTHHFNQSQIKTDSYTER